MNGPSGAFLISGFPWGLLISRKEAEMRDRKVLLSQRGDPGGKCPRTDRMRLSLVSSPLRMNELSIMNQGKVDARENGFSHTGVELGSVVQGRDYISLSPLTKPTHG